MIKRIQKMVKKILAAMFFISFAACAYAVDHYVITAPSGIMAGDDSVSITVTPMEGAAIDITPHKVKFVNLPAGVTVSPNDIFNGVPIAGQTIFSLNASPAALSGSFTLRIEKSNDAGVYGESFVTTYLTVTQYTVEAPTVPFTGKAGEAFMVRVTARDKNSAVVGAYKGDVDVAADIGDITVNGTGTVLYGTSFNNGVAYVPVVLFGTTIGSLQNSITVTARKLYPGQSTKASGKMPDVTIEPNIFHHVLLFFPGENIDPGRGSGKLGAANNATAGIAISNVNVYLCDQYHNPIRTDRNPEPGLYPVNVNFTSNRAGDTVATAKTFALNVNSININNEFIFPLSMVSHEITATEDHLGTSNSSSIYVESNSASIFEVSAIADPQSAVSPFSLTIEAKDTNGNVDTSYNRTVDVIGLWGTGNALGDNTVDTVPVTAQAENTITFVNGQWNGSIKVTRAHTDVFLRFDDNNGHVKDSNHFRVIAGSLSRLWITLPGEVFTEGAYPGNASGVGPNSFTAGDVISITVRAVDASWNQVAVPTGYDISVVCPNGVIDAPTGVVMDAVGEKVIAGIQLRTAGDAILLAASIALTPLSNSNPFTVNPKPYNKLVLVSPGEQLVPGIFPSSQPDGKTGSPNDAIISESFEVTICAVDEYFNPISVGVYPTISFASTDSIAILNGGAMGASTWTYDVTFNTLGVQQLTASAGSKSDSVAIEVVPGPVNLYEISTITSPKDVAVPFNIVINAKDAYGNITPVNNMLDLNLSIGQYTVSPATVTLSSGVWAGAITCYASGDSVTLNVKDQDAVPQTGTSNAFNIKASSYTRLLLLLDGENHTPGVDPNHSTGGKTGTPTPKKAGESVSATIIACDDYFNAVAGAFPTVELVSDHSATFMQNPITITTYNGIFTTVVVLREAADHTIYVRDLNNDPTIVRSTSTVTGLANDFKKLLLVVPGQSVAPGTATGRSGTALVQTAGIPFDVTVYAVDAFWNRVTSINTESIIINSDENSIAMNPPFNQGYAFSNGEIVFTVHLGKEGSVKLTASDASDATKTTSQTDVQVAPGAAYEITAPATANAGQAFTMTVRLIDSKTGLPGNFNHTFYMSPVLTTGEAALGTLNITNAVLVNGEITIVAQNYNCVEGIKIKITDSYSRVQYSSVINVVPNGLSYDISVPSSAVAGPPSQINVKVDLKEQITGTHVNSMDHKIGVMILDTYGLEGVGTYDVKETYLVRGTADFNVSYTKAENISIRIWDKDNTTGFSPTKTTLLISVRPDTYKKLQIKAPGEELIPGVPSVTGKDSTGIIKQKQAVSFTISVLAVDQYWNVVNYNGGSVRLSSDDASLTSTNPSNQGAAFVNGLVNFTEVTLYSAGNIKVTAADTANTAKDAQSVYIPVSGAYYEVMAPTQTYSGPPSTFMMSIVLKDSETGDKISANHKVYITPKTPSRGDVEKGVFSVTEVNLENGIADINNQAYNVAEDIVARISDDYNRVSFSDVISFVPREVSLIVTAPDSAKVGPPETFNVNIKLLDVDTGNSVARYSAKFSVEAISTETGLTGTGNLLVQSVDLTKGELTFIEAYTKAEGITLKVSSTDQSAFSNTINMIAGDPTRIAIDVPSEIEAMQENVNVSAVLYDMFNNPVSEKLVSFKYSALYDGVYLSAEQAYTDGTGTAQVQLITDSSAHDTVVVGSEYGSLMDSRELRIKGSPQTDLFVSNGISTEMTDSIHIKTNTPISLQANCDGLSLDKIMYSIDNGDYQLYTGPFMLPVGQHTINYYSISVGAQVHTESAKASKSIFVSAIEEDKLVNFPNPFRAGEEPTFIEFRTNIPTNVTMTVYTILGQLVWEKDFYYSTAGLQREAWWGRNGDDFVISNGGYILVVNIKDEGRTMKRKIAVRK